MIRFRLLAAWLGLGVCGACIHTRTTGNELPKQKGDATLSTAPKGSGQEGGVKVEPGRPALAHSPKELRHPGGSAKIRDALKKRGYLGSADPGVSEEALSAAVRSFQADQKIARTGFTDRETLRRLGLNPEEIEKLDAPRNE